MLALGHLGWPQAGPKPAGTCNCSTSKADGMEMAGVSLRAMPTEGSPVLWLSPFSQMQQLLPLPQPAAVHTGCTEMGHVAFVPREGCWGSAALLFSGPQEGSLTQCLGLPVAWRPDGNK